MSFDSLDDQAGSQDGLDPLRIAHNSLFTAREKLDLLNQLKAEIAMGEEKGADLGFSIEEVDGAIAEVRQGVQDGIGTETALKGDL